MNVVAEKDLYLSSEKRMVLDKDTHCVVKFYLTKDDHYYGIFKNEAETLSKLVHPNIVSFFGTVLTPHLGIVMEYCEERPIAKIIFNTEFEYSLRTILWWTEQLFRAVCYLSELDIVHANINHQSTLVAGGFGLKLAGFGYILREGEPKNHPMASASDVYSVAVLIWEIVERGKAAFDEEKLEFHPFAAKFTQTKPIPLMEPNVFKKLQNLVESGTQVEAEKRTPVFSALLKTKNLRKVRFVKDLLTEYVEWLKSRKDDNLCESCLKDYVHDVPLAQTSEIQNITPTTKTTAANDETDGSKTCPRGFCRYITTTLGSSNACLDQSLVCPQAAGPILSTTIAGPADSNLNCPPTTKCVGGETTSNGKTYYGNFCVKA